MEETRADSLAAHMSDDMEEKKVSGKLPRDNLVELSSTSNRENVSNTIFRGDNHNENKNQLSSRHTNCSKLRMQETYQI